jgi:hypothetical protein
LDRIKEIEETQKDVLKKKRESMEKKEQNQFRIKEDLVNEMLVYGLWQFLEVVD